MVCSRSMSNLCGSNIALRVGAKKYQMYQRAGTHNMHSLPSSSLRLVLCARACVNVFSVDNKFLTTINPQQPNLTLPPCLFFLQAKSQFKSRSIANNVEIIIPVPNDVDSPSFKASIGSVTYLPDQVCTRGNKVKHKKYDTFSEGRHVLRFESMSISTTMGQVIHYHYDTKLYIAHATRSEDEIPRVLNFFSE